MIGLKLPNRKKYKDEAEKPFWISFSDLMTALMVLFLVAMTVALLAVTREISEAEKKKEQRKSDIDSCMIDVGSITNMTDFHGVVLNDHTIEFGARADFEKDKHTLTPEKMHFLRQFVPQVLEVARHPSCKKWLKRVIVEGFASKDASYLYNLNLSLQRSQRVMCVLLDSQTDDRLNEDDRRLVRKIFLIGGSSFNSVKKTPEESRRVELKLEFRGLDDKDKQIEEQMWDDDSKCYIETKHG